MTLLFPLFYLYVIVLLQGNTLKFVKNFSNMMFENMFLLK